MERASLVMQALTDPNGDGKTDLVEQYQFMAYVRHGEERDIVAHRVLYDTR